MVSSSVRTTGFLNSQAVSTRKEISSESRTDDFAKMMDESINKAKNTEVKDEVKTEIKVEEKKEVKEDEFDGKFKETVENDKAVEVDEVVEEEPVSEEISEEILSAVAAVLNISVGELKASLEKLGIEGKDLLDMENVTKLVMDLKNINNKFELLVHKDANDVIKDVQKSIAELMENIESNTSEENVLNENVFDTAEKVLDKNVMAEENVNGDEVQVDETVVNNQVTQAGETDTNSESMLSDDNEKGNDLSKNEKTESTQNNPLQEMTDNILKEIEVALEEKVDEVTATRMVREIADNITVAIREKLTSLEMQLNPENLGKVTVLLATEESGITAKIAAETEMAKNAIEQQLTILKENFEKQGLKVTEIEVTIASHGFEQNLDGSNERNEGQQKKNNRIRQGLLDELNGVVTEEQETEEIMKQALGNTVSYLA